MNMGGGVLQIRQNALNVLVPVERLHPSGDTQHALISEGAADRNCHTLLRNAKIMRLTEHRFVQCIIFQASPMNRRLAARAMKQCRITHMKRIILIMLFPGQRIIHQGMHGIIDRIHTSIRRIIKLQPLAEFIEQQGQPRIGVWIRAEVKDRQSRTLSSVCMDRTETIRTQRTLAKDTWAPRKIALTAPLGYNAVHEAAGV